MAIQDYTLWCLMQNSLRVGLNFEKKNLKLCFWKLKLKVMCFEKLLESFTCISCHEKSFEKWFCRKIFGFSKNSVFQSLDRLNLFFNQLKISRFLKLASAWLDWYSIDVRPIKTEKFSVFKFLTNFFFHVSFMLRIYMHVLFFCIHLTVL